MPYYDFWCYNCDMIFTKKTPLGDLKTIVDCPKCDTLCQRTGFHPVPFYFKEKN